jgi:5-methylcytosine-specific restriction endonuclease McrA
MRPLPKPDTDAGDFFILCLSKIRNPDLKARLTAVKAQIVTAASGFETAVEATQLHHFSPHSGVGPHVTTEEMVNVYTSRMAKEGTPGRELYDQLLTAPPQGQCPLCGQRDVASLDHHLPKMQFPQLAVLPTNLIPACSNCNRVKLSQTPQTSAEETLHPYYDQVNTDRWLCASVAHSQPAAVSFQVVWPPGWNTLTHQRMQHHFTTFELAPLYATHAAVELNNMRLSLTELFATGGAQAVRQHLEMNARSCQHAQLNSWQTALYNALANDTWFHAGGFI